MIMAMIKMAKMMMTKVVSILVMTGDVVMRVMIMLVIKILMMMMFKKKLKIEGFSS